MDSRGCRFSLCCDQVAIFRRHFLATMSAVQFIKDSHIQFQFSVSSQWSHRPLLCNFICYFMLHGS